jgi:uncharacterized protein (TIGR00299 family) protein
MVSRSNDQGNVIFFDCFAGIAGDMFLASLLDMSRGEPHLREELKKMPLEGYEVRVSRDVRGGISGLRFDVIQGEGHSHRHLADIERIITQSSLSDKVKLKSIETFRVLAEAEAKVHGEPVDHVHFHEVGAVDSIIDIAGAMIMLEYIGWPNAEFSCLNVGSGTVMCEHGMLPVPAPAAAELLKGMDVCSFGEPMERVTPTGAALVKTLAGKTSHMPSGKIVSIGIGLGRREGDIPNLLRATLMSDGSRHAHDRCAVLSANIDDMTPQDLSVAMERLFDAGALDVWFEHIQMKKNRPGVKLCCLSQEADCDALALAILKETTSLGVRRIPADRTILERRIDTMKTDFGDVRVKSAISGSETLRVMPEFDDVRRAAYEYGMSMAEVRALIAADLARHVRPGRADSHGISANSDADESRGGQD